MSKDLQDAVIIGGGFYGAVIATYLVEHKGFSRVTLVEREAGLLQRASFHNQARVHNGYHYPRSFTTAYRSRLNMPKFVKMWQDSIKNDFLKLYAIARNNSKVNAQQFERFCMKIGANLEPASEDVCRLFNPNLVAQVFKVEECVFDANKLRTYALKALRDAGVSVRTSTEVTRVLKKEGGQYKVCVKHDSIEDTVSARCVFNCTYSGLNQIKGDFPEIHSGLKHEITEMCLLDMPQELEDIGVTVMDGPFFSCMPFPAKGLYSLSHVRYTPHQYWADEKNINPYKKMDAYSRETRVQRMLRDAGRYLPAILSARYCESLFEVKTILVSNENDDGRPILFEKYEDLPGIYSVMGGKIDNVFDILEKLESENFVF